MLRKQARQRREYLYTKSVNERIVAKQKKTQSIIDNVKQNKSLSALKGPKGAANIYKSLKYYGGMYFLNVKFREITIDIVIHIHICHAVYSWFNRYPIF